MQPLCKEAMTVTLPIIETESGIEGYWDSNGASKFTQKEMDSRVEFRSCDSKSCLLPTTPSSGEKMCLDGTGGDGGMARNTHNSAHTESLWMSWP